MADISIHLDDLVDRSLAKRTQGLEQVEDVRVTEEETLDRMLDLAYKVVQRPGIPHICHLHHLYIGGEKIGHVEKFQISIHNRCGEIRLYDIHHTDIHHTRHPPHRV